MENWKARRAYYASKGRPDDQPFEDTLGRRILKGLGCTEKHVYRLEQYIFSASSGELPLWIRASKLFLEMLGRSAYWGYLARTWHLETRFTGANKDAEILDLLSEFELTGKLPVFFTLPKSGESQLATVYSLWPEKTAMNWLNPPYRVIGQMGEHVVVAQEASHFVAQFGKYDIGSVDA